MASQVGDNVPVALQALTKARSSGILTVHSRGRTACFALHWGEFLYATSDVVPRLGDKMVAKGLVNKETLKTVLSHQRDSEERKPLGTIMFELGLVSREAARHELEEQVFLVLREVLSWEEGDYSFLPLAQEACEDVILPGCTLETHLLRIAVSSAG